MEGEVCGIVCHYPIYGDRLLIGRSNLLYACTNHYFILFSASRWHRRAGGLQPTRTRTMVVSNKMWSSQVMCFIKTTRSTQTPFRHSRTCVNENMRHLRWQIWVFWMQSLDHLSTPRAYRGPTYTKPSYFTSNVNIYDHSYAKYTWLSQNHS